MKKVSIRLKRSLIRRPAKQRSIVYSLGLTDKINSTAEISVDLATVSKLRKVAHLIKIDSQ